MPKERAQIRETSAVELAYDGIIDLVLTGRLRPGERTSVYLLTDTLGIGRTPVREAINRLQSEGFLSVAGRSGTIVNPIDADRAKQMFALRRCLECFAAGYAVANVTDEVIAEIDSAAEKMSEAGTTATFVRANTEFHSGIVALAANPTLDRFYAQLQIQLTVAVYLAGRGDNKVAENVRKKEHSAILNALRARDVEALKRTIVAHIDTTERAMLDQLL
ncbi:GntR family transcriptional regulator [Arenibacterium sp. LLYu02]|uniref:GntR family transcriptional regulator n=1 Tax=Arenibacterium sp. LLYu02 TaxID=3404132 RepID=UPI003B218BD7